MDELTSKQVIRFSNRPAHATSDSSDNVPSVAMPSQPNAQTPKQTTCLLVNSSTRQLNDQTTKRPNGQTTNKRVDELFEDELKSKQGVRNEEIGVRKEE